MSPALSGPSFRSRMRRLFVPNLVAELNSAERRILAELGSLANRVQALEGLSQTTATRIGNSEQVIRALQNLTTGLQNELQLEFQRLRRGAEGEGANERAAALYLDLLEGVLTGALTGDGAQSSVGIQPYDELRRSLGRDWPAAAETMIGRVRMRNLRNLVERALQLGVKGDFIETGVWRGGACIYVKAIFEALGEQSRKVFVADSFRGLPPPDGSLYPADAGDTHFTYPELAVSREAVEANFRRYGLLDDQVVFIEGWFKESLPSAPVEKLCVLRLDGDLYESTIVALDALYHKVSPGGFVIVDDYLLAPCAQAVTDFRSKQRISEPLQEVDGAAVWWQVPS
jgi:O-methyltransferase